MRTQKKFSGFFSFQEKKHLLRRCFWFFAQSAKNLFVEEISVFFKNCIVKMASTKRKKTSTRSSRKSSVRKKTTPPRSSSKKKISTKKKSSARSSAKTSTPSRLWGDDGKEVRSSAKTSPPSSAARKSYYLVACTRYTSPASGNVNEDVFDGGGLYTSYAKAVRGAFAAAEIETSDDDRVWKIGKTIFDSGNEDYKNQKSGFLRNFKMAVAPSSATKKKGSKIVTLSLFSPSHKTPKKGHISEIFVRKIEVNDPATRACKCICRYFFGNISTVSTSSKNGVNLISENISTTARGALQNIVGWQHNLYTHHKGKVVTLTEGDGEDFFGEWGRNLLWNDYYAYEMVGQVEGFIRGVEEEAYNVADRLDIYTSSIKVPAIAFSAGGVEYRSWLVLLSLRE